MPFERTPASRQRPPQGPPGFPPGFPPGGQPGFPPGFPSGGQQGGPPTASSNTPPSGPPPNFIPSEAHLVLGQEETYQPLQLMQEQFFLVDFDLLIYGSIMEEVFGHILSL